MNAKRFGAERMAEWSPAYGATEAAAMWRLVHDFLIRKAAAPPDPTTDWVEATLDKATAISRSLEKGMPLQYALQEAWFDNRCFWVDESVLIPRPETEELLDWIRKDFAHQNAPGCLLDVGTGSGILAISLKKSFSEAQVIAVDKSVQALRTAQRNAERFGSEISFLSLDFTDRGQWKDLPMIDLLVSNPPYIPEQERSTLPRNVVAFEPAMALFVPDNDPLLFYRLLGEFGRQRLLPGGRLYVEVHEDRAQETGDLLESIGYGTEIRNDLQGKPRMVRAVRGK